MDKTKFSYYEFYVGRYLKSVFDKNEKFVPYKENKSKLVWNVFYEDFNDRKNPIKVINLFEFNWVFLKNGLLYAKKHYANDYIKFADHIRSHLQYEYWSRCEYETIITTWPCMISREEALEFKDELDEYPDHYMYNLPVPGHKIDVYTQVMMNWDRFIDYVWNNKRLITKKKLGLK